MCNILKEWSRVKIKALGELALTVFTLSVIEYAFITNKPLIGLIEVQNEETEESEKQVEEEGAHKYIGRALVVLAFFGMFGILCCVATILTDKFASLSLKGKRRTIACWLLFNALTMVVLTALWGGIIYFVVSGNEKISAGADIQIPFGLCYVFRCAIILGICKIWNSLNVESEYTVPEDVERENIEVN